MSAPRNSVDRVVDQHAVGHVGVGVVDLEVVDRPVVVVEDRPRRPTASSSRPSPSTSTFMPGRRWLTAA